MVNFYVFAKESAGAHEPPSCFFWFVPNNPLPPLLHSPGFCACFFGKTLVVSKSSDLFGLISLIGYRDYHLGIWWSSYHHGTSVGTSKQVRPYDHRSRSVSRSDRVSPGRGSRVSCSSRARSGRNVATSQRRASRSWLYLQKSVDLDILDMALVSFVVSPLNTHQKTAFGVHLRFRSISGGASRRCFEASLTCCTLVQRNTLAIFEDPRNLRENSS